MFGSRQVIGNFVNLYLLSFFSNNKIIKSDLFHPGCAVIKPQDLETSHTDVLKLFLNVTF